MMNRNELKVGNVHVILAAIAGMKKVTVTDVPPQWAGARACTLVEVSTDTTQIDALRAEMEREREGRIFARERDNVLIRFQEREFAMGAWRYRLSTNIYGFCVGESLKSNMGGGTYSQTRRGSTMSECIAWGCTEAKHKNVRFSFELSHVPEEFHGVIRALVNAPSGS